HRPSPLIPHLRYHLLFFFSSRHAHNRYLHSFPTRRSSDLPTSTHDPGSTFPGRACFAGRWSGRRPIPRRAGAGGPAERRRRRRRSEEHTSELQSRSDLVCRLLLEKKKQTIPHLLPSTKLLN